MARARNIKPGFFRNADLAELPFECRLLFAGLWTLADRCGRLEDRHKQIKMEVFPADSLDVDSLLEKLDSTGLIVRYGADGHRYIWIRNFLKHQNPHVREPVSAIPPCDQEPKDPPKSGKAQGEASPETGEHSAGTVPARLNPESPILNPEEQHKAGAFVRSVAANQPDLLPNDGVQQKPTCPAEAIVSIYHELMPDNPRVKVLNEARRGAIRARWKEAAALECKPFGYGNRAEGLAAWREFFEICADSDFLTGKVAAQAGKPPFLADIDFLMSPSGFAKILENKYHREVAA